MEKVLLLALGDDYWTRFVMELASEFRASGIDAIIATDSHLGEYQCFGKRVGSPPVKTYYLSDFLKSNGPGHIEFGEGEGPPELKSVFPDYFRLYHLGARSHLRKVDWICLRNAMYMFFREILHKENIGVVVHDQVSTSFSYACAEASDSLKVDYFGLVGARVPGRYEIRRSVYGEHNAVEGIYGSIDGGGNPLTREERDWAVDYLEKLDSQQPSYMINNFLNDVRIGRYLNRRKFRSFLRKCRYVLVEREETRQVLFRESPVRGSIRSVWRNLLRLMQKRMFVHYEDKVDSEWLSVNRYYVYPLHYQPEASTSVGSPHFVDQLNFIRNVAFSLPEGAFLLVKEHQSAVGYNSMRFYEDIASLPQVKLLGPDWNIKELIRKSVGVITLTSTAGFEALLLGRRVFMFGSAFFQCHPLCCRVGSWEELATELRTPKVTRDIWDNQAFLVAYRRYTRAGIINYDEYGWGIGDDLMAAVKEKLDRRSSGRVEKGFAEERSV